MWFPDKIAGATQAYNRYAYVNNNPLSFTDPSGFFFKKLKKFFKKVTRAYAELPAPVRLGTQVGLLLAGQYVPPDGGFGFALQATSGALGAAETFAPTPSASAAKSAVPVDGTFSELSPNLGPQFSGALPLALQSGAFSQGFDGGLGFLSPEHFEDLTAHRVVLDHLADA